MLSAKRDTKAAKRFFKKVLKAKYNKQPRVINVDKNAAYPPAIEQLKKQKVLDKDSELRQVKYLNNLIEQDHRFIPSLSTTSAKKRYLRLAIASPANAASRFWIVLKFNSLAIIFIRR